MATNRCELVPATALLDGALRHKPCSNTRKLTDRVAIAAGVVEKLDEVVAGDDAGGDDISEGGHLGR